MQLYAITVVWFDGGVTADWFAVQACVNCQQPIYVGLWQCMEIIYSRNMNICVLAFCLFTGLVYLEHTSADEPRPNVDFSKVKYIWIYLFISYYSTVRHLRECQHRLLAYFGLI